MKNGILRIIDANLNRAREGLRVCEEIARFILEDANLTAEFKKLRHQVSSKIKRFPGRLSTLVECRQTQTDIGKTILTKGKRKGYRDVFCANIQRVKEGLRVLEEFSKIFSQSLSSSFGRMRFRIYELEKKIIARL